MNRAALSITVAFAACMVGDVDDPEPENDDTGIAGAVTDVKPSCNPDDANRVAAVRCYTCKTACDNSRPSYCAPNPPPSEAPIWPAKPVACLEADPYAGGVAYRWFEAGENNVTAHQGYVRPFMLIPYMKKLRNAANADPTQRPVLEQQVNFLLSHGKTYPADTSGPTSTVWQGYYNQDGVIRAYADGLNQAAYVMYFLSLAKQYASDTAKRDYYLRVAYQFDNAMERPHGNKTGGIRRAGASCGQTSGACWYFHSRAPTSSLLPGTALNQSLFVIKTATEQLVELANWSSGWPSATDLDRNAWLDRLRDRVSNGLTSFAYGTGNTATNPDAPPLLKQHMRRKGTSTSTPYYWADYEFDMVGHAGREVGSKTHVCNYHTVSINDLGIALANVDTGGVAANLLGSRAARIGDARAALISYTRNGAIEPTGASDARHALYQWFVSDVTPALRQTIGKCPAPGDGDTEALFPVTRQYLCKVFGGTSNQAIKSACP